MAARDDVALVNVASTEPPAVRHPGWQDLDALRAAMLGPGGRGFRAGKASKM